MSEFDIFRRVVISRPSGMLYNKYGGWFEGYTGPTGPPGPPGYYESINVDGPVSECEFKSIKEKCIDSQMCLLFTCSNPEDMEELNNLLLKYCKNDSNTTLFNVAERTEHKITVYVGKDDDLYPLVEQAKILNNILSKIHDKYMSEFRNLEKSYYSTINNIKETFPDELLPYLNIENSTNDSNNNYSDSDSDSDDNNNYYGYIHGNSNQKVFAKCSFKAITREETKITYRSAKVGCIKGGIIYDKLYEMGLLNNL